MGKNSCQKFQFLTLKKKKKNPFPKEEKTEKNFVKLTYFPRLTNFISCYVEKRKFCITPQIFRQNELTERKSWIHGNFNVLLKSRRVDIFTKVSIKQPSDFTISFPFFENVGRVSRIFLFFISKIVCKNEISKTECFVYIRLRFSQRVRADLSAEYSKQKQ